MPLPPSTLMMWPVILRALKKGEGVWGFAKILTVQTWGKWSLWQPQFLAQFFASGCSPQLSFSKHPILVLLIQHICKGSCRRKMEQHRSLWLQEVPTPLQMLSSSFRVLPCSYSSLRGQPQHSSPCHSWHWWYNLWTELENRGRIATERTEFCSWYPLSSQNLMGMSFQYILRRSRLSSKLKSTILNLHLPAQLIKISRPPNFSATAVFMSSNCISMVRSHWTTRACEGKFFPMLSSSAMSLPTSATLAPLLRYQYARVRPMPEDAPVITTDLFRK